MEEDNPIDDDFFGTVTINDDDEPLALPDSRADDDTLASLHGLLTDAFIKRIRSGKASPSDLNAARQFLKDNNISCDGPRNAKMCSLADGLPDSLPDFHQ